MKKITQILVTALTIIMSILVVAMISTVCSGCTTQASHIEGEPISCYNDRYRVREKTPSDVLAKECANADRREWCTKMLTDEKTKDMFKDFNDCWRQ